MPSQQICRNGHVLLRTIITTQIPEDIIAQKCKSECHRDIYILQKSFLKNCPQNDRVILRKVEIIPHLSILDICKTQEVKSQADRKSFKQGTSGFQCPTCPKYYTAQGVQGQKSTQELTQREALGHQKCLPGPVFSKDQNLGTTDLQK